MGAITGKSAKVKITSAAATTAAGEAFVPTSPTTDYYEYRISDAAKRHWDNTVTPTVYVNSTAHTDYSVNYVQGKVTFQTARSTAETITADLSYFTASYLPWTRSFALDINNDVYDVTAFSTSTGDVQWRSHVGGLSTWTADLGKINVEGTTATPEFFDRLNTDTQVVVEFIMASTYKFEGYGVITSDSHTGDIDALQEEAVTLQSASPLYYATTE